MKENDYLNGFKLLGKYGLSYQEVVKLMDDCSFSRVNDNSLCIILDNSYKYLLNKGYSLVEIKKMVTIQPRCLIVGDRKRQIIEDTFLELGMTFDEFKYMSIKCCNIYSYSKERIDEYINFFRTIGLDNNDISRIFKYSIFILRSSIDKLNRLYDDMIKRGFSADDIFVISKSCPSFWTHNFNKIDGIINIFISFGFDFDEVKVILRKSPSLIGYSNDTILYKFNELINLGFSKEELVYIVLMYPTIINIDIDRTRNIIEFFKNVGLYECLLMNPKCFFMQSLETSYARYCFYVDNGKIINRCSYSRLFCGWKKFEKINGIGKDELFERYPYIKKKDRCKKK